MQKQLSILVFAMCIYSAHGQALSCETPIELCKGTNIIPLVEYNLQTLYTIVLYGQSGNIVFESTSVVDLDGNLYITLHSSSSFVFAGTYSITDEMTGNTCWGEFLYSNCADYIIPPPNSECGVVYDGTVVCPFLNSGSSISKYVKFCVGDTTDFNIASYPSDETAGYILPFDPDRLMINNGYLISYNDNGFTVVWDIEGEDCMILKTTYKSIDNEDIVIVDSIFNPIRVKIEAKTQLQIKNDIADEVLEVCLGEKVTLYSEDAQQKLRWTIDDGTIFYGHKITTHFTQTGTYTVRLDDISDCNCSKPDTYTIIVKPGESPGIQCVSTICQDEEVTYYSEMICDTYLWSVSAEGTITDGGGVDDYFVTIQWNNGPIGQISLETPGCITAECRAVTTVDIPIIADGANIIGADTVCHIQIYSYTAPDYEGTEFTWSIPFGNGSIFSDPNSPTVNVKWFTINDNDIGILQLDYENCNLDCAGTTQKEVLILNKINIINESIVSCESAEIKLENDQDKLVEWSIEYPDGSVVDFPVSKNLITTLSGSGTYKIKLYNHLLNSCNYYDSLSINIYANPDPPSEILGSPLLCQDYFGSYLIENLLPYQQVYWEVFDGSSTLPTFTSHSKELYYTWQSTGPYNLQASIVDGLTGCQSTATSKEWNLANEITTVDTLCLYSNKTYRLQNFYDADVTWSLSPSDAGVLLHSFADSVNVLWQQYGDHQLIANYCNYQEIVEVHIPTFDPIITVENTCKNETGLIKIDADPGSTYSLKNIEGVVTPIGPISYRPKGQYQITVTSKYGCIYRENIQIQEYPDFNVDIFNPPPFDPCSPFSVVISTVDFGPGYTYKWYKDNQLSSSTTNQLTITESAYYSVLVTDPFGCQSADTISIPYCTEGCIAVIIQNVDTHVDISTIDFSCNEKEFEIIPPYESTDFDWTINRDLYQTGGTSAFVTFPKAGYYQVCAYGDGGCDTLIYLNCTGEEISELICEESCIDVIVPVVAYFSYDRPCINEPMSFTDKSSILPGATGLIYDWDFGDPASGVNNTSNDINPQHIYTDLNNHTVTLVITDPSGCTTTAINEVSISAGPVIDVGLSTEACVGFKTYFTAITSETDLRYHWDFGDFLLGISSTSIDQNPSFIYTADGTYTVSLTATNPDGCSTMVSKDVSIITNDLFGDIISDTDYPKCVGDPVHLSAITNADNYFWSTGDTTEDVTVVNPGNYSVTLTNNFGCEYYTTSHQVSDFVLGDAVLYATTFGNTAENNKHFDSLVICIGQPFLLQPSIINDVNYLWSNGRTSKALNYSTDFADLAPGSYSYQLTVQDKTSNCEATLAPFKIIITDLPDQPIIDTPSNALCENQQHTLSILSPKPNEQYRWSTGDWGQSITVSASDTYTVVAINELGCESQPDTAIIHPTPSIASWLSGCLETCFPKEICIRLEDGLSYELINNESTSVTVHNDSTILHITEPGDYQLQATNEAGCTALSEMLTLTTAPTQHSLYGIVYFDHNENGMFDLGDELLPNIPVTLLIGNSSVYDTLTDATGSYNFDTVQYSNMVAVIDPTSTGYTFIGNVDSLLIYSNCGDIKEINFPLIPSCSEVKTDTIYTVCAGQSIVLNGIEYEANDIDSIRYPISANCDSIVRFRVEEIPLPLINLQVDSTCSNAGNGILYIENVMQSAVNYSVDEDPLLFTEETLYGLESGDHNLYINDANGCQYIMPFYIPEITEPTIIINTSHACEGLENGSLTIDSLYHQYLFGIDEEVFSSEYYFTNISPGMHMLYIQTEDNCVFSQPFVIGLSPSPDIAIMQNSTCQGMQNGSMNIIQNSTSIAALYSLDNITFSTQLEYTELQASNYTLYAMTEENCLYEFPFIIEELPTPILEATSTNSCIGESSGSIAILSDMDDLDIYINDNPVTTSEILDMPEGQYTLTAINAWDCETTIELLIETNEDLLVEVPNFTNDCQIEPLLINPKIISSHGELSFNWSNGSTNSFTTVSETGILDLVIQDDCNSYTHSWNLVFTEAFNSDLIHTPNIFSPNGDGSNDCFRSILDDNVDLISYQQMIFDRWGNRMFLTTDVDDCWDGKFQGIPVVSGVYVYVTDMIVDHCEGLQDVRKVGDVTVIY